MTASEGEEEEAIPASTGRSAPVRKPSRKAEPQARQDAEAAEKKGKKERPRGACEVEEDSNATRGYPGLEKWE